MGVAVAGGGRLGLVVMGVAVAGGGRLGLVVMGVLVFVVSVAVVFVVGVVVFVVGRLGLVVMGVAVVGGGRFGLAVRRRRGAVLPVDGLHALEGHVEGAVDGGERLVEDAHDGEGHVVVGQEAHFADPVRHRDVVTERVVQLGRHVRAEGHVEQVRIRPALRQRDLLSSAVAVVAIEILVRADDPEPPVAVPQAVGDRPLDRGVLRPLPVGLPRNVLRRRSHAEDRIQQQLDRAALRAHDQVGLADRVGEALPHAHAHVLDADQKGEAEGDGAHRERCAEGAVAERLEGEVEHEHQKAALLMSGSEMVRENMPSRVRSWLTNTSVEPARSHS